MTRQQSIYSNNIFLLILGEIKNDQLFVEKLETCKQFIWEKSEPLFMK